MTIEEMIEQVSKLDLDTIVHIAYRPNWPLAEQVSGLAVTDGALYLAGGRGNNYLPAKAAELLDWNAGGGRIDRQLGRSIHQSFGLG